MKKTIILTLAFVFMFASVAPQAHAQMNYTAPSFSSKEEQIAYLQGVLNQLLAQYGALHQTTYQYQPHSLQTSGRVLGAQYADVAVSTRYVNYSDGEAEIHGYADLKGSDYAYVWFEYGDDRGLDEDSSQKKLTRDGSFSAEIDDFEEDEYFYYRAAAEDDQGRVVYGEERAFYVGEYDSRRSRSSDDEPEVDTKSARDIEDDRAELRGEVDMNDFNNGYVFFVYGEDEDQVEDVDREDQYRDIDEDGDDLQKEAVDSDLDGDESYTETVTGLDDNTDHYFRICVEYEDEDGDDTLECGDVEHFETD